MDKVKNIFIAATFGLFVLTLTNSCHKYPDDPFISLKTSKSRLIKKDWTLVKYLINGVDVTSDFNVIPADSNAWVNTAHIWFNEEPTNQRHRWWTVNPNGDGGHNWSIEGNLLYLDSYIINASKYKYLFPRQQNMVWKILELYNKKFRINAQYDNKWYEIWFERK